MTEQQHPITPPPELVEDWMTEIWHEGTPVRVAASDIHIATQAANWGADQELEACCVWFQEFYKTESWVKRDLEHFRAARRPKPPSLKELALSALEEERADMSFVNYKTIQSVLEQLDD